MFSDPNPGWFVLAVVLVVVAAMGGETVPIGPAVLSTVVLFGLWRLSLVAWERIRYR
jgi:tellurite resistance protein TehA-like permease